MSRSELRGLLATKPQQRHSEPAALTPARRIAFNKKQPPVHRRGDERSYSITRRTITRFRSKLLLLDAQEMCLCGLLSISHSVHLILCIEVFFALILLIQSPDLLTMNGTYFYFLGFFDGGGFFFFSLHVSLCVTCLISAALLYVGSRCQMPVLVVPHVFWQFTFIIVSVAAIIVLMTLGIGGKMLLPSSIVLSSMMAVAGGCEMWWCLLSIAYYRHISQLKDQSFSTSISPQYEDDDPLCARDSLNSGTILSQLNDYRETLYIIFGITCLVSWLCFNLWALREFFCPTIFHSSPRPEDRLTRIKMQYISSGRLLTNLTSSRSATSTTDAHNIEIFVV
ncbi:unnamed protein product [Caenorhabditis sp. 36 PRJEB53466]|nr:unnamed protein product [Caenorhabditis sp. 36 PRJEB53466]